MMVMRANRGILRAGLGVGLLCEQVTGLQVSASAVPPSVHRSQGDASGEVKQILGLTSRMEKPPKLPCDRRLVKIDESENEAQKSAQSEPLLRHAPLSRQKKKNKAQVAADETKESLVQTENRRRLEYLNTWIGYHLAPTTEREHAGFLRRLKDLPEESRLWFVSAKDQNNRFPFIDVLLRNVCDCRYRHTLREASTDNSTDTKHHSVVERYHEYLAEKVFSDADSKNQMKEYVPRFLLGELSSNRANQMFSEAIRSELRFFGTLLKIPDHLMNDNPEDIRRNLGRSQDATQSGSPVGERRTTQRSSEELQKMVKRMEKPFDDYAKKGKVISNSDIRLGLTLCSILTQETHSEMLSTVTVTDRTFERFWSSIDTPSSLKTDASDDVMLKLPEGARSLADCFTKLRLEKLSVEEIQQNVVFINADWKNPGILAKNIQNGYFAAAKLMAEKLRNVLTDEGRDANTRFSIVAGMAEYMAGLCEEGPKEMSDSKQMHNEFMEIRKESTDHIGRIMGGQHLAEEQNRWRLQNLREWIVQPSNQEFSYHVIFINRLEKRSKTSLAWLVSAEDNDKTFPFIDVFLRNVTDYGALVRRAPKNWQNLLMPYVERYNAVLSGEVLSSSEARKKYMVSHLEKQISSEREKQNFHLANAYVSTLQVIFGRIPETIEHHQQYLESLESMIYSDQEAYDELASGKHRAMLRPMILRNYVSLAKLLEPQSQMPKDDELELLWRYGRISLDLLNAFQSPSDFDAIEEFAPPTKTPALSSHFNAMLRPDLTAFQDFAIKFFLRAESRVPESDIAAKTIAGMRDVTHRFVELNRNSERKTVFHQAVNTFHLLRNLNTELHADVLQEIKVEDERFGGFLCIAIFREMDTFLEILAEKVRIASKKDDSFISLAESALTWYDHSLSPYAGSKTVTAHHKTFEMIADLN